MRDQVIAAHKAYIASLVRCTETDPGRCDLSSHLVPNGEVSKGITKYLADLAAKGYRTRSGPGPRYAVHEGAQVQSSATQVALTVCTVDGDTTFWPGGGPGGEDVIVNDQLGSDRSNWVFRLVEGVWRLDTVELVSGQKWKGTNGCPPDAGS